MASEPPEVCKNSSIFLNKVKLFEKYYPEKFHSFNTFGNHFSIKLIDSLKSVSFVFKDHYAIRCRIELINLLSRISNTFTNYCPLSGD